MNKKRKIALIPLFLLAVILLLCACGQESKLDQMDASGYTVSVKFDANGGEFTTFCSVIMDSFNISGMATNANGMVELALITPDNDLRGANDTFTVAKNGYFLAGWYATRTEIVDAEGNVSYTYADKWDFETDRLEVDPSKQYTAAEPVVTLYAAWVPVFEVNFYTLGTNELLHTETCNPLENIAFQLPEWDEKTGGMDMNDFPARNGYTFKGAYYDAEGTQPVEGAMDHPGYVDYATGTAVNPSVNVYVDWTEGEWYRIYTAQQLADSIGENANYELFADLDFTGVEWPERCMYSEFTGTIIGNGHTISNVTINQRRTEQGRFGLFGSLGAEAVMEDVTFDNITVTITGVKAVGAAYGLFAGSISENASISNVQILNSQLQIPSDCWLASNDYVFGLVCGMGNYAAIDFSGITAVAVGNNPESVQIDVDETDGTFTVVIG